MKHFFQTLRNFCYKINQKTKNGEDIFNLNLLAYVKKYPAVYLTRHVFMLLKDYELARYVIIADCGGFDIELLPSVKEMEDLAKIVSNYIINNIAKMFVI